MRNKDTILLENAYEKIFIKENLDQLKEELYRYFLSINRYGTGEGEFYAPEEKEKKEIEKKIKELQSKLNLSYDEIYHPHYVKDILKLKKLSDDNDEYYDDTLSELEYTKELFTKSEYVYYDPDGDRFIDPKNIYKEMDLRHGNYFESLQKVPKNDLISEFRFDVSLYDKAIDHLHKLEDRKIEDEEFRKVGSRDMAKAREMSYPDDEYDDASDYIRRS